MVGILEMTLDNAARETRGNSVEGKQANFNGKGDDVCKCEQRIEQVEYLAGNGAAKGNSAIDG